MFLRCDYLVLYLEFTYDINTYTTHACTHAWLLCLCIHLTCRQRILIASFWVEVMEQYGQQLHPLADHCLWGCYLVMMLLEMRLGLFQLITFQITGRLEILMTLEYKWTLNCKTWRYICNANIRIIEIHLNYLYPFHCIRYGELHSKFSNFPSRNQHFNVILDVISTCLWYKR